ncbi:SRPBCC family protein [Saccharothrix coeruleofusca]|uniref:Activator of Hsp90 ATPase homologue 1/2-like C-terminal domain-containing protein n=1 Tax=Saccharothrix coeruleofusca TaxID=33919 RepID=A0A918AW82_9PSEU|nr:SRPBCC family protein [Saccharothrix coeruleofusca]GGP84110.1 hypothetical protein GCM10010185_67490 [Saccharothrix coeruleofusca]
MSETLTLRVRARVPAERVHRALTDGAELATWLAERAEVDLPDRYQFWGRHTPEGDRPRQRPLRVDDRAVSFGWHLGGEDTTVEFLLADEEGGTLVTLTQSHFPGWRTAIAETSVLGYLYTYWCLALANLVDHVEGRPLTPKPDFTSGRMRAVVDVAAPVDEVYDALVDPVKFERWFGAKVDIEPEVGGRFAMGGFEHNPEPATIVDLRPGRAMTVDWGDSVSTWELEGSGGRTRMTFTQSGFDEGRPPFGAWLGWLAGVAELRRFLELPDWRPMWLTPEVPELPDGILTDQRG